MKTYRI